MTTKSDKLQSIQVFRGAAALLVLLFHATGVSKAYLDYDFAGGIFVFGHSGVDFFFVLSGFIIFLIHRRDAGCPERVIPYLKKRFVRIYPVYWIVALAIAPIYFGIPRLAGDFTVFVKSFLLLPQIANPVVTVAWSLTHEVFFYVMFGLAIFFPWRYIRLLFIGWLLITLLFQLAKVASGGTFQFSAHTSFLFSAYNLEFAMGCLAAYLFGRYRLSGGRTLFAIGITIFLACGFSEGVLHSNFANRHSILGYGVSSMAVVLGAVLWERRKTVVFPALLLLLGDASYSIYLTHFALLDLFARGLRTLNLTAVVGPRLAAAMIVTLSLGAGVLFYQCVERPLLARLQKKKPS